MGLYPVPPGMQDNRLKENLQGQSASDTLLQEFIAALQEPPKAMVQAPPPISDNDRLYMALRGSVDPEFRKRAVEPALAERASYPTRLMAAQEDARQQRVKELGSAVAQVGLFDLRGAQAGAIPETTVAKTLSAQAAMLRARRAFEMGGKPYTIPNVVIPEGFPFAGEPGVEFGITDPMTGERNAIGYRRKSIRGVVITNEKGTQTLQDPTIRSGPTPGSPGGTPAPGTAPAGAPPSSRQLATGGISKQPGPGIQRDIAQNVSTIDGFAELVGAYDRIAKSGTGYGRMARETAGGYFPRVQEREDPEMAIFVATRRASLNRYIKAVTGAQFSIAELERYEAQLPGSGAGREVAMTKISLLAKQAIETFRTLVAQNGGLERIARDPELQKQIGIVSLDVPLARKALGLEQAPAEAASAPGLPPGITPGSTLVGRSKSTGRPLWRNPAGKLEMED